MKNKNEGKDAMYYLEKAPVSKAISHMAIPMIMGMIINMIYNITDAYYIGQLDNTSMMASLTLALPFVTVLMAIGEIFGTGGSTYIARLLGEKDIDGMSSASDRRHWRERESERASEEKGERLKRVNGNKE